MSDSQELLDKYRINISKDHRYLLFSDNFPNSSKTPVSLAHFQNTNRAALAKETVRLCIDAIDLCFIYLICSFSLCSFSY